jgi:predicted dehydrogenase/nucleoside-diphosphate-sugar epimerase
LRIGFVGAGQMARQHLNALGRIGVRTVVVGVHDPVAGRAKEFAAAAGTQAFRSIDALTTEARPNVVHVCTPPAAHFDAAHAALDGGAHVYVEKPFALTTDAARTLLNVAASRGLRVCSGHQLLRDRAFEMLMTRAAGLGEIVQADSHFAFRPIGPAASATASAMADQVVDVLPHPLYTLVAALERFGPPGGPIEIAWAQARPADLHAVLSAGNIVGRLSVSLRARPVASSLTVVAAGGSLTCDFVRSIVVGAANPGTEALEKILNPAVEGLQLVSRSARSLSRRLRTGASYPGLAELIESFYRAVAAGHVSPVSSEHLLRVTALFEQLVARVEGARRRPAARPRPRLADTAPLVVVTGARGFLGGRIAKALDRVRGIGRGANPDDPHVDEWVVADLSTGIPTDTLAGASVVVHAAAETAGSYDAHQRNTIDATRHLLHAMRDAGVRRLVLVSSLSVLRPPRTPWERQHEATPRPANPRVFGPYVWGKSLQEALVEREAAALGISTRIIRPGALIDWSEPELPGLMGRHLFGRWHLGLGRPTLPVPVCEVGRCAEAIAWCAKHFDKTPPIVNLVDPTLTTRGAVVARLREHGWQGRILWIPISVISLGVVTARTVLSVVHGRLPERFAAWSILRPRHYDANLAATVLEAAGADVTRSVPLRV